mgnify:CR=1 FL=1
MINKNKKQSLLLNFVFKKQNEKKKIKENENKISLIIKTYIKIINFFLTV